MKSPGSQAGFGVISAVFILVILAFLGVSITFMAATQRGVVTLDIAGSRAYQAARAGVEWGAYQALRNGSCAGTANPVLPAGAIAEFTVTVTCVATTADEGGTTVTLYNIVSNACNAPAAGTCPNAASNNANYTERQVTAVVGG